MTRTSDVLMGAVMDVGCLDEVPCVALKVEDFDGGHERWLVYSKQELEGMRRVISTELCSLMRPGRLFRVFESLEAAPEYYMRMEGCDAAYILIISRTTLQEGEQRAREHQGSMPEQGWISDLLD